MMSEKLRIKASRLIPAVLVAFALLMLLTRITVVRPGFVGVKVRQYGSSRGVQHATVTPGMQFLLLGEQIHEFPISMQRVVWTASPYEGRPVDESFPVTSKEGAALHIGLDCALRFDPAKVPLIFERMWQDPEQIINGYLRNRVRNVLNDLTGKYTAVGLNGPDKGRYAHEIQDTLQKELGDEGFQFDSVTLSEVRFDNAQIQQSISAAIQATQDAIRARNHLAEVRAESEQKVIQAKAEGDALLAKATSQAEANRRVTGSLTPALIQWQHAQNEKDALTRWNGQLPQVTGGSTPMINLTPPRQ